MARRICRKAARSGPRPHRRVRHHEAGIREVRALFGEVAAEAARQHIIADLKEEGWTETDPFPQDEHTMSPWGCFEGIYREKDANLRSRCHQAFILSYKGLLYHRWTSKSSKCSTSQ